MFGLAEWGARYAFGDPEPEELDPEVLMWWLHDRIDTSELWTAGPSSRSTCRPPAGCSGWSSSRATPRSATPTPAWRSTPCCGADIGPLFQIWEGEIELLDAVKAGTGPLHRAALDRGGAAPVAAVQPGGPVRARRGSAWRSGG